jgi:hypothetical protein
MSNIKLDRKVAAQWGQKVTKTGINFDAQKERRPKENESAWKENRWWVFWRIGLGGCKNRKRPIPMRVALTVKVEKDWNGVSGRE